MGDGKRHKRLMLYEAHRVEVKPRTRLQNRPIAHQNEFMSRTVIRKTLRRDVPHAMRDYILVQYAVFHPVI